MDMEAFSVKTYSEGLLILQLRTAPPPITPATDWIAGVLLPVRQRNPVTLDIEGYLLGIRD